MDVQEAQKEAAARLECARCKDGCKCDQQCLCGPTCTCPKCGAAARGQVDEFECPRCSGGGCVCQVPENCQCQSECICPQCRGTGSKPAASKAREAETVKDHLRPD